MGFQGLGFAGVPFMGEDCFSCYSWPCPKVGGVGVSLFFSGRDCPNSGQASPCASEQSPSPQSPQNNCSGKSADPKNVAALKVSQVSLGS